MYLVMVRLITFRKLNQRDRYEILLVHIAASAVLTLDCLENFLLAKTKVSDQCSVATCRLHRLPT